MSAPGSNPLASRCCSISLRACSDKVDVRDNIHILMLPGPETTAH